MENSEQTFISHLVELRTRLLHSILCVAVVLLVLMPFSNYLYEVLSAPLLAQMKDLHTTMIATEVASPFLAPFKLTSFVAVAISVPYLLYQAWSFIAPGLYLHEKKLALPLLVASVFLFYAGIAFAYFVVFPLVFGFFATAAPEGVTVMTDIRHYLDFVLTIFFAFGACFEVPVVTYLIVRTGIATREDLAAKRPYVIVSAFVVGAILTPPDVVSQTLLSVPIWLLYELGLVFCRFFIVPETAETVSETAIATTGESPKA